MVDNSVALSAEEQEFFDSKGETAPEIEKPVEKAPVAKETKKTGKTTREVPRETEPTEETVVTKTPAEEKAENLEMALREERRLRAESERRTEERLRLLQEVVTSKPKPEVQPEVIPDPDKDAMGALKYLLQKTRQGEQQQHTTAMQQEMQRQSQAVMGEAARMENDYLRQQPDYDANTGVSQTYNEASGFLVNMRKAELAATGSYNPVQINQILANEAIQLADNALRTGKNPAQVVMDIAKARGFKPIPKQAAETEQEKINRIAKGQEAGFSLSQATGSKASSAGKGLDAKTIATMSDEDFSAFVAKAKKSDLRQIFGD